MVARNTTSEFFPAPPKTRIPRFGSVFSGKVNVAVLQPAADHKGRHNMCTAPVTNGDRVAGVASSKALSVKGTLPRV